MALISTITDDETEPISILKSNDVVAPTRIVNVVVNFLNPSCSTANSYSPGGKSATTIWPSPLLITSTRLPRSLLTTIAFASETALPAGSVNSTDKPPVSLCAFAEKLPTSSTSKITTIAVRIPLPPSLVGTLAKYTPTGFSPNGTEAAPGNSPNFHTKVQKLDNLT